MRRRDQVVERPRRAPYCRLRIDVPREPEGPWTFRIPRLSKARATIEALAAAGENGDHEAMDAGYGALIAMAWADEVFDLEARDGLDVVEELYEAGWSQAAIWGTANVLRRQVFEDAPSIEEVRAKVDFFDRPGALAASLNSESESSASGTSSPSTA